MRQFIDVPDKYRGSKLGSVFQDREAFKIPDIRRTGVMPMGNSVLINYDPKMRLINLNDLDINALMNLKKEKKPKGPKESKQPAEPKETATHFANGIPKFITADPIDVEPLEDLLMNLKKDKKPKGPKQPAEPQETDTHFANGIPKFITADPIDVEPLEDWLMNLDSYLF